jgi:hypothetical protein
MPHIHLYPKIADLLDKIEGSKATILGLPGSRGCGKSKGLDDVALTLGLEQPRTLMAVVMRNFDQVYKYHVEPLVSAYPELQDWMRFSMPTKLMIPNGSRIDFSYAESLEDVKRRFRSGNYRYLFVDQAEQFTGEELREMMLANRDSRGAKTVLSFNMGGVGIQELRNWFHLKKFNEREDPANYDHIHMYAWDNVYWALPTLEADGLTEDDYYSWTDEQRFLYFITYTEYGRKLNALDDAVRNRDLLATWDSLEGAFFGRVFDYKATMVAAEVAEGIIRPWDVRWMSTDWGKTHFCSTHWHGKSLMTPREIKQRLGWDVPKPLNVVSTYRRFITNEETSTQVGKKLVTLTPKHEREKLQNYFFSPEQFGDRDSEHTTADLVGMELSPYGMPQPEPADNKRKLGFGLMYTLLNNTRIWATPVEQRTQEMELEAGDTVWVISSECPEILEAIPLLMRNIKDLDDVVKSDLSQTDLKMDVSDDCRYGLQSMLGSTAKPEKIKHAERLIEIHSHAGYSQELTFAEMAFRASQNQPAFSVSGRRRR